MESDFNRFNCISMNINESQVSIIVTFYNVEKYIGHCIDTLIKQTYQCLEIILVNDASPDRSLEIALRYAEKDKRLKVINLTKNVGVDKARFKGLEVANGDYIMFVDSDDYLPLTAVETLLSEISHTHADVVEGNMVRVLDKYGLISKRNHRKRLELTQPELFDEYYISFFGRNVLNVNLWGKIYRKDLFDKAGVEPTGMRMGEDLVTNMQLFPFIQKYVVIDDITYCYRWGGMTSRFNPWFYPNLKEQYFLKMRMIEKYAYSKAIRSTKVEMCNILHSNLIQMFRYHKPISEVEAFFRQEITSGFVDEITSGVESGRPYFKFLKAKDVTGLFALCKQAARDKWLIRWLMKSLFSILR